MPARYHCSACSEVIPAGPIILDHLALFVKAVPSASNTTPAVYHRSASVEVIPRAVDFLPARHHIACAVKVVGLSFDFQESVSRITSVAPLVPPASAVLYPGSRKDRNLFRNLFSTDCADSLPESGLCFSSCFNYFPASIYMIFHRNRTCRVFIKRGTYGTMDRLRSFFCAGCFLIDSIIIVPFVACCGNRLCLPVSTVSAYPFTNAVPGAGCFQLYSPIAVRMLFLRNRAYCALIDRITYGAVF